MSWRPTFSCGAAASCAIATDVERTSATASADAPFEIPDFMIKLPLSLISRPPFRGLSCRRPSGQNVQKAVARHFVLRECGLAQLDRKGVGAEKSVSGRVDLGWC